MLKEKNIHSFLPNVFERDIDNAVKIFQENNCPFELMHCVSTYPMKTEDANLCTIKELQEKYNCNVGYSGA